MQRYFAINQNLELALSDIYHMYRVMRMKPYDKIEIMYDGIINICQITEINIDNVKFDLIEKIKQEATSKVFITIAISLVAEQKWDYILQKATELGADEIIPLCLSRTIIKIDNNKILKKHERWLKICKEAAEQSHRLNIPNITNVMGIDDLNKLDYDLKLVCSTGNDIENIKQILSKNKKCDRILVVIGPEGGISKIEEKQLTDNGFQQVSLGNLILRVETAPLFFLSIINYELMR